MKVNFFKNIYAFRLLEDMKKMSDQDFESAVSAQQVKPCGKYDLTNHGWDGVFKEGGEDKFFLKASSAYILKLKINERILPSSVVKERVDEIVEEREESSGAKLKKSEINAIKEAVTKELLPQAFIKSSYLHGYIDTKNKLLVVDAGSPKRAELFVNYLRETFGSMPVELINNQDIGMKLTQIIKVGEVNNKFGIGKDCVLKNPNDKDKITATNFDLCSEQITNHVENGLFVTDLDLIWQQRISFRVTSDFKLKKIKFTDIAQEQINEDVGDSGDQYAYLSASMMIMVEDFAEMLNDLEEVLTQ